MTPKQYDIIVNGCILIATVSVILADAFPAYVYPCLTVGMTAAIASVFCYFKFHWSEENEPRG
jgi:uncharacterized membrane protein